MVQNDKDPVPAVGNLSPSQLLSLLKMEPKTLGAIQIIIGALILCLSASVLQIHEVHFTGDVPLNGNHLFKMKLMDLDISFENFSYIYSACGRRPSLFWVSLIQTNSVDEGQPLPHVACVSAIGMHLNTALRPQLIAN
uniref:Si:dkey-81h8.1 n=1 Tax=Sparus aurata TaxID=8175 RepID=A0A671UG18_SPAAU